MAQVVSRRYSEDLLQDTWLRIHEAGHTYHSGEPVLPWIYAIARHVRVDSYRKAQRIETHEQQVEILPERAKRATAGARRPDLFSHIAAQNTFTTAEIYRDTLSALELSPQQYSLGSLRYDLSKLRAKGLVERVPRSRRYRLLREGYSISFS